jgi:excisionase family DNA binding protein
MSLRDPIRMDPVAVHTLDEAAAILRVKTSWLERQAAARKIPFTMLGGAYRFTPAHLAAIVRLHERGPGAETETAGREAAPRRPRARQRPEPQTVTPLRPRPRTGPRRAA